MQLKLLKIYIVKCYSQKPCYTAKTSTTDAIKSASKRAIQKTTEATGNKIADKITKIPKTLLENYIHKMMKLMIKQKYQKKDTHLQKKDNKLLMS